MHVELINTGTELMLGRVLNTHQQWLCRKLTDLGYRVARQVSVPDTAPEIEGAVREALGRADLVITTGGLGPTSDDLTRDRIAALLGKTLDEDPAVLEHIKSFFDVRGRPMPEPTRVQALVPNGALVLPNQHGTAPGLALKIAPNTFRPNSGSAWLIMLPGPPRELRPMFEKAVAPLLIQELPLLGQFQCCTIRTTGIGESLVQEKIAGPLQNLVAAGLEIGYCARPGEVDIRLCGQGPEAEAQVREAENIVRAQLHREVFASGDEELAQVVIGLLTRLKKTVALAESCTGGYVANQLTNVPGASAVFTGGLVSYSNDVKKTILGVQSETLQTHGAVSELVAREMAEGARRELSAEYGLSLTGIAGPGGGTPDKPVGTVFIGLCHSSGTMVKKYFNPYDRETFKQVSGQQALDLLRIQLLRSS